MNFGRCAGLTRGPPATGKRRSPDDEGLTVDQSPEQVFDAINSVRGWWSGEVDGRTDSVPSLATATRIYHRSTQKITELVRGKRVAWHVLDA